MTDSEDADDTYLRLTEAENRVRDLERTQLELHDRIKMLETVIVHLVDESDTEPNEIGDSERLGNDPVTSIQEQSHHCYD